MASDKESFYMKELKNKYGENNVNEINRAIRFRANIIVLKMMFEEWLEVIPHNYRGIGLKGLYDILGTNRTDFSKMYNGHIYEARKKMKNTVSSNDYIKNLIDGTVLFKIGNMEETEDWRRLFNDDDNIKEALDRINKSIKVWISNVLKLGDKIKDEKGKEYAYCLWMWTRIKEYVDQRNNSIDRIVNEKVHAFKSLTFEELDSCQPYTIHGMYQEVRKVYNYIECIYQYKCKEK